MMPSSTKVPFFGFVLLFGGVLIAVLWLRFGMKSVEVGSSEILVPLGIAAASLALAFVAREREAVCGAFLMLGAICIGTALANAGIAIFGVGGASCLLAAIGGFMVVASRREGKR